MKGAFVAGQAEGALPNGSRVRKIRSEPADWHQDGALATVVSSIGPIPSDSMLVLAGVPEQYRGLPEARYGYFVEWDDDPDLPVFVAGHRLRSLT